MSSASLVALGMTLYLAGAVASLLLARDRRASGWAATAFTGAAGIVVWAAVIGVFAGSPQPEVVALTFPAIGSTLAVRVDGLSAIFLAITATIAFLATLFSVQCVTRYEKDGAAKYYPLLLILFAAIVGVVVTHDFVFFLVSWELMTFASFFLVSYERENATAQRAALKYFVMNQAGALSLLAGALILWTRSGSFHFAALRDALGGLLVAEPLLAHIALFLFFVGFATKAGILPMGDWLPDAYPAAPSAATAAFAGTMTKLGIYGIVRVFLFLLPLSPATRTWGVVIALVGTGSLFVGTLAALRHDDVKRLMSFHVIGQVGYMCLGIGMGLYFLPSNPGLAALGFMAGVFHMINHALYKSLLFLGGGAVLHRTGSRSLAELGGLRAAMPVTAMCALGGSLAIAGVPPLNGFASKWLLYVTAILGGRGFPLFVVLGVVAMFISLVTLASFLKYMGGVFLGSPRSAVAIREVPFSMTLPQIVLAGLCVLFGLVPLLPLQFVHAAIAALVPEAGIPDLASILPGELGLRIAGATGAAAIWSPLPLALALIVLALLVFRFIQRAGGASVRKVPVWTCGEEASGASSIYPATSFYLPFKRAFHGIYPTMALRAPAFPPWLRRAFEVDTWFYLPVGRAVDRGAHGFSRTHVGIPQIYLLWIVVGAVCVIGILLAFVD